MPENDKRRAKLLNDEVLSDPILDVSDSEIEDLVSKSGYEDVGLKESIDDDDDLAEPAEPLNFDEIIDTEYANDPDDILKAEDEDPINNPIVNEPTDLLNLDIEQEGGLDRTLMDPSKNDKLLSTIRNEEPLTTLYNGIMEEIGEELAYLKMTRKEAFLANEDNVSDISFKRVKALRELVETLVKREQSRGKQNAKIDFHGEAFENVMAFILKLISETFEKSGIPPQFSDIFFTQFGQELEKDFEKRVEKIYYGKK